MDVFKAVMDAANARSDARTKDTIYQYVILDGDFNPTNKTGKCYITNRYYHPCMDYNIISFVDIDSGEKFRKCQFYVKFIVA